MPDTWAESDPESRPDYGDREYDDDGYADDDESVTVEGYLYYDAWYDDWRPEGELV